MSNNDLFILEIAAVFSVAGSSIIKSFNGIAGLIAFTVITAAQISVLVAETLSKAV